MLCPILIGSLFYEVFYTKNGLDFPLAHGYRSIRPTRLGLSGLVFCFYPLQYTYENSTVIYEEGRQLHKTKKNLYQAFLFIPLKFPILNLTMWCTRSHMSNVWIATIFNRGLINDFALLQDVFSHWVFTPWTNTCLCLCELFNVVYLMLVYPWWMLRLNWLSNFNDLNLNDRLKLVVTRIRV